MSSASEAEPSRRSWCRSDDRTAHAQAGSNAVGVSGTPTAAMEPSARKAAEIDQATPYALRHSFASLLLHEGRSVIYVARQLGRDARLTLARYGHVIDERTRPHPRNKEAPQRRGFLASGASRARTGDLLV